MALAVTLATGKNQYQELVNIEKKLQIIQQNFPDANPYDIRRLLEANSRQSLQFALKKLTAQGIRGVKVSQKPFNGNFGVTEQSLIDIQNITVNQFLGTTVMGDQVQGSKVQADHGGIASGRDTNITGSNIGTYGKSHTRRDELADLAQELYQFRAEIHGQATDPEQDVDLGQIAAAEIAARSGDRRAVLLHLKTVGSWVLDFATQVGATITAEFMKKAMGM